VLNTERDKKGNEMAQVKLRVPVDSLRVSYITTGAEPRVADRDTGALAMDTKSGLAKYKVHLVAVFHGSPQAQTWAVNVVGDPGELPLGMPVKVTNLELQDWQMTGDDGKARSGLTFVADKVELLNPPTRPPFGADQKAPGNGIKDPVKS
jgi:hypothetical protein